MGFSSMVRAIVRVVAFVAIACLSLQAACTLGIQPLTSAQDKTHGDGGCHESVPLTPQPPAPSHVCYSGDHSLDALLSTTVAPVPMIPYAGFLSATLTLRSFAPSTDLPASFSPPRGPLALRI